MMRCGERMAVAVRSPDGDITVHKERVLLFSSRLKAFTWPILRGISALIDALRLGVRALMFSANAQARTAEEELSAAEMTATMAIACILAVTLFVVLPTVVGSLLSRFITHNLLLNVLEGVFRLTIVVGYIATISRMPDVGRVFEYHGAEHMVINAWEARGCPRCSPPVEVQQAREEDTVHFRCGTSFILMVALVSIFLYTLFGWPSIWMRLVVRFAMLPVVAGVAYELISIGSENPRGVAAFFLLPGLWVQRLTTRPPDDAQLQVAIAALKGCLCGEEGEDR